LSPNARFCRGCGKALTASEGSDASSQSSRSAVLETAAGVIPVATAAVNAAVAVQAAIKTLTITPGSWNVVVGDQLPDIAPLVGAAARSAVLSTVPTATSSVPSVRGPVWSVAITTATDLVAAYATGNPAALDMSTWRAELAVFTLIAGLVAGSKRGWMSRLTMLGTLALAAFQCGSLLGFADQLLQHPNMLSGLLPNVVTQSMSLIAALRLAWLAKG
jgi:hypothetical protein